MTIELRRRAETIHMAYEAWESEVRDQMLAIAREMSRIPECATMKPPRFLKRYQSGEWLEPVFDDEVPDHVQVRFVWWQDESGEHTMSDDEARGLAWPQ